MNFRSSSSLVNGSSCPGNVRNRSPVGLSAFRLSAISCSRWECGIANDIASHKRDEPNFAQSNKKLSYLLAPLAKKIDMSAVGFVTRTDHVASCLRYGSPLRAASYSARPALSEDIHAVSSPTDCRYKSAVWPAKMRDMSCLTNAYIACLDGAQWL